MTPLEERVATLEAEVAKLKKYLGLEDEVDPLAEATVAFQAENRAKAKAGVKPPGRM